jgi:enoyl-[acyl-carrier-protein] reductase (NADH)
MRKIDGPWAEQQACLGDGSKEIGDAVAFVCSERASAINGAAVRVDGGLVRSVF